MIILNLLIKNNDELVEVVPFSSQSALILKIKSMAEETGDSNFINRSDKMTNNNIVQLVCDSPIVFENTIYEGTRLYISELQS